MNRPSACLRQTERLSPNAATSAAVEAIPAEGPFIPAEDGRRGTHPVKRARPPRFSCSGDGGESGEDAFVEAIAEAANTADEDGSGCIGFNLLAEPEDVNVHGTVGNGAVVTPNGVEKLFATEDNAWACHQKFEKAKFGGGELKVRIVELDAARGAVEFEISGLEHFDGGLARTEVNLDAGNEFAYEERLDDVIVGTEFKAQNAVRLAGAGGEKDHWNADEFRVAAYAFADVESVGIGKHDVEQDEVGLFTAAEVDCAPARLRTNKRKSFLLQVVLEERKQVGVIFDQNDFLHVVPM